MIASVSGKIKEKTDNSAVIDVHGVGYLVAVPRLELAKFRVGQEVNLHTYLIVREDALDLYGSQDDKVMAWFKMLLNVRGVGPKSALAIISIARPQDLSASIAAEDSDILVNCGIGKKAAERIVLELKNKAKDLVDIKDAAGAKSITLDAEALQALEALGYSREQARDALRHADGDNVETKIRGALKTLGK